MGARLYAPSMGAWTELDTVAGSAQDPRTMNRFVYVHGNPTSLVDPSGHGVDCEIGQSCDPELRAADTKRNQDYQRRKRQEQQQQRDAADGGRNDGNVPADKPTKKPEPEPPPAVPLPTSWDQWRDLPAADQLAVAEIYGPSLLARIISGEVDPHDLQLWLDIADTFHILVLDRNRVVPLSASDFYTDDELVQMADALYAEGTDESVGVAMWMLGSTQAAAGLTEGGEADFAGGIGSAGLGAAGAAVPRPAGILEGPPPQHIGTVVEDARTTGQPLAGHRGGGPYMNDGRRNTTLLPALDSEGREITFTEFDVNPVVPGSARDAERVVVGRDPAGHVVSIWYTPDHYYTWFYVP